MPSAPDLMQPATQDPPVPPPAAAAQRAIDAEWPSIREDAIRQLAQLPASAGAIANPLPPSVTPAGTALGALPRTEVRIPVLGGMAGLQRHFATVEAAAKALVDTAANSRGYYYRRGKVSS
jgi:hypothetical protein